MMAGVKFNISLMGEAYDVGYISFQPNETIRGTLSVFPEEDLECKHLYVRLLWHTEGRGTTYINTVEEFDLYQGTLRNGLPSSYEFTFTLPDQPWSYSGHYISIVWKVEAQVDLAWAKDPKEAAVFVLRPLADGIQ
jgi:hypothetical protein